ncbi:hypothetical protein BDY19DRAFT_101336 [Irpex rosettiformis]|uniref:Uncharacterized protein n=1 Tax=Irpex rosettiformis TaxID=378272 RepID=A0ACB8U5F9_9APHY|nr:hypothetical protein BDY19DRAFT_101336 [Irpex rosettiformis]
MASTSSIRQAIQASQHMVSRKAPRLHSTRRPMGTASAMNLSLEDSPVIDLQIFDIFDAPSRLGESSKLLSHAASLSSTSRPERPISTVATSQPVSPLPTPIIFDGPSRPRHLEYATLRTSRRAHSYAPSSAREQVAVAPLPAPVMFDGPSRLRPYVRGSWSDESVSLFFSIIAVAYHA